jgi:hypothetical protein
MVINTLITIKDSLTAFVNGHAQLKHIGFEADDHREPIITQFKEFPILFVAPIDVYVGRAMNVHTLRIYVYERINDDRLDVWENANDTSLILRDIRVWWNDYGTDAVNIVDDPIGTFASDRELDNLVGYYADFRFEIPSHGRCDVPVNVVPTPPIQCQDAVVVNSDNTYEVNVPSGATLELPDITVTDSDGTIYNVPAITDVVCTFNPPCEDATAELVNSIDTLISTTTIPSGETAEILAPDENIVVVDEDDTELQNVFNPAQEDIEIEVDVYCEPQGTNVLSVTLTDFGSETVYYGGLQTTLAWQINAWDLATNTKTIATELNNPTYTVLADAFDDRLTLIYD